MSLAKYLFGAATDQIAPATRMAAFDGDSSNILRLFDVTDAANALVEVDTITLDYTMNGFEAFLEYVPQTNEIFILDGSSGEWQKLTYSGDVLTKTGSGIQSFIQAPDPNSYNSASAYDPEYGFLFTGTGTATRLVAIDLTSSGAISVPQQIENSAHAVISGMWFDEVDRILWFITVGTTDYLGAWSINGNPGNFSNWTYLGRFDITAVGLPRSITGDPVGKVVYIAGADDLMSVDVSTPATPVILQNAPNLFQDWGGPSFWDADAQQFVMVGTSDDTILVVDASNPSSMTLEGQTIGAGGFKDGAFDPTSRLAYGSSSAGDGIRVVNVDDISGTSYPYDSIYDNGFAEDNFPQIVLLP